MKKLACKLISLSDFSPPFVYNSNILNRTINKLSYQNQKNSSGLHITYLVMFPTCIEICNKSCVHNDKIDTFSKKLTFEKKSE